MQRRPLLAAILALGAALATACLGGSGPGYLEDETPKTPPDLGLDDGGFVKTDADIGDPFSIEGLSPSHGPFTGGTRALIAGRGFSSKLRVFVGGTEVQAGALLASDPTRAAIETPPGPPGFVDVRIRDEATAKERVLKNGFYYDAFVVEPSSGATSGGTRIAITGSGTTWSAGTKVAIGGAECLSPNVVSPTRIECATPASTPGVKDVTVTTPDGKSLQARDAYTYSDSTDGYRGGLSGGAISATNGRVKVLAFDSFVGTPILDAYVIAGPSLASGIVKRTGPGGVTEIDGLTDTKVTITVAAECHQPVTFVDVPVDTVTAYLDPVLDLSCAKGDPPSGGGRGGRYGGLVEGQLIFPGGGEFERLGWTTVPNPTRPTERRAAYVFDASTTPSAKFQLPPANEAITPDSVGAAGYKYSLVVYPGNVTVYVVAGLEDRSESPPRFVPYAMGVARGITVPAQTRVQGVDVKMDVLFDHQVTLDPAPPAPGPRGPDRLEASIAVTLGAAGYAILPRGTRTVPLPFDANLPFVGVPSLDRALAGEQYVLGAIAATGPDLQRPASSIARIRTANANTPVVVGGFLGVPVLGQPGAGTWAGDPVTKSMHVSFGGAAGPVDLTVIDVSSGNGLVSWTIVAPGAKKDFDVPDLGALDPAPPKPVGLVHGAIGTTVYVARIDDFAYGKLRYGQLSPGAWNAHAVDAMSGAY